MTQNEKSRVAELHTKAAYSHTAAAFSHSTGDHSSGQELAKKALGDSIEAVRHSEEIAKDATPSLEV